MEAQLLGTRCIVSRKIGGLESNVLVLRVQVPIVMEVVHGNNIMGIIMTSESSKLKLHTFVEAPMQEPIDGLRWTMHEQKGAVSAQKAQVLTMGKETSKINPTATKEKRK